jgi:exonuclease III
LDNLVRIATYNVNSIKRAACHPGGLARGRAGHRLPTGAKVAPMTAALRATGYGAVWHGQKSWNSVAILSRGAEPAETRRGRPDTWVGAIFAAAWYCQQERAASPFAGDQIAVNQHFRKDLSERGTVQGLRGTASARRSRD